MNYAIAGGAIVGVAQLNESQLDRLASRLRKAWRNFIDALTQPGKP